MSLMSQLVTNPDQSPATDSANPTQPVPQAPGETKWLVIAPDIFPGEDILVVIDPNFLEEAQAENPGLVTYLISEIDALKSHEQDFEFRRKIHLAKKLFGGWVRPVETEPASTV